MENLASKYRPRRFEDVVYQDNVMKVLLNQLQTKEFKQGYLFTGSAGTGKTTTARIFASEVNRYQGIPIEIDGASNNGVDNIREIIDDCRMKPLNGEYKIYIIDEVHMLSIGAFNALLKILEEPPKHVIFILCTTDPQKIPATILSRLQRFDFKRIPTNAIVARLKYIITNENYHTGSQEVDVIEYNEDALLYIAKLANGGMRDAIMKLDTVLGYTSNVTVKNVINCLGISSYDEILDLLLKIGNRGAESLIEQVTDLFINGVDLKLFMKDVVQVILDLIKLNLTHDITYTYFPVSLKAKCMRVINELSIDFLLQLMDKFNHLNSELRYEQNPKALIESELILLCMKY